MTNYKDAKYQFPASGITSGTLADARIASSNVTQHVVATDLQPVKSDITALAIREATNESSAAFNLPSSFIEAFTDDTNLGTETQVDRDTGAITTGYEALATTATELDWFTPKQAGGGTTPYQTYGGNLVDASGNNVWRDVDVSETSPTKFTDCATAVLDASGFPYRWWPSGSTKFMTADFKENKLFSTKMKIGKNNGWGDTNQFKVEYSTDNSSWSNVDFSSSSEVSYEKGPTSGGAASGGGLTGTPSSSGTFNLAAHNSSAHFTGIVTLDGIPDFTARYIKVSYLSHHGSGTNMRNGQLTPFLKELATTYYATGTLIQSANAVTGSRTKVGGTIMYKDVSGTNILGTDLKIYFTADGGSNWTEAAGYTAITPVYSTGVKQVRLSETTVTGGTDVRYKAVWANQLLGSKVAELHGIGLNY